MLKYIVYVFLMLFIPLVSVGNDKAHALFEKGNEQYAKSEYKEAALSYQKILDEGYESAALYYNLGNACYKMGNIPSALLYYEKAHKLSPGDKDIDVNIQFARLKTADKLEASPEFFLADWWHTFILSFSLRTLSVLSVLFFLSGFFMLIIYLFTVSVTVKKSSFYTALVLVILGLTTVLMAGSQTAYFASHHEAIIFTAAVTVKSEPSNESKDLFVIHAGAKVGVLEDDNGWMKIELSNGNVGWISSTDAKEI